MKRIILTSILLLCAVAPTLAQRMGVWGVAFYNLETFSTMKTTPTTRAMTNTCRPDHTSGRRRNISRS